MSKNIMRIEEIVIIINQIEIRETMIGLKVPHLKM